MAQLLLITICLPMLGAGVMWALAPLGRNAVRSGALAITLATLVLSVALVAQFPADGVGDESFAVAHGRQAAEQFDVRFSVGLDGVSVWMFGLSALLMVSAVLVSWDAIKDRAPLFYGMLLLLESGCLGVFAARDIILFYVFFEFTLIPLYFLIGIWGSEERRYAAVKFFLFTLAGSLLTFIGLLSIVIWDYTQSGGESMRFSIPALTASLQNAGGMPVAMQCWIFFALLAGFAVKVPLFPVHTWLPLAHVQAPAAGSVFLAGILLKIGTYGFLRFNIPMLPDATVIFMPFLLWMAAAGIVYGALAALAQGDMKRLIAYSSVSHLGYCVLGLFALNRLGVQGGALQMINHGISTGGLFAIIGMMYERYHTRDIKNLGGLARQTPWLAFFMLVFTFSSIGLPGLNGFAGEFLVLAGMFQRAFAEAPSEWAGQFRVITLLALSGVVLGAWYMLWLVQRVFFGPVTEPKDAHDVDDMNWREFAALAPLVVFVLWIGLQPNFFLQRMAPALQRTTAAAERRLQMDLDAEALQVTRSESDTPEIHRPRSDDLTLSEVESTREPVLPSADRPAGVGPAPLSTSASTSPSTISSTFSSDDPNG